MDEQQPAKGRGDPRFVEWLSDEAKGWERQGLITAEQAQAIMSGYSPAGRAEASQRAQARLITILATLGAILVGLGIILFIAGNWDRIPQAVRLAMIMVLVPSVYGVGYWLRYVKDYQRVGVAVLLLGAIIYGAAVHLVAQVYNIPLHDPMLFTYIFAGILPLAYLTRSQAVMVLTLGVFLAMIGFWVIDLIGESANEQSLTAFVFVLYTMLGLGLFGLGRIQGAFKETRPYSIVFQVIGLLTVMVFLYLLTFVDLYESFSQGDELTSSDSLGLWILLYASGGIGILAIATVLAHNRSRLTSRSSVLYEGAAVVILAGAVTSVTLASHSHVVIFPLLFNALFFLSALGLIFVGYLRGQHALVNGALAFFALGVITRYFELSWDLLDRSIVFLVGGIILLAIGFLLERGRRKVLQRMAVRETELEKGASDNES